MNIYEKLNKARVQFHELELKKTGKNTFAKYTYFELGDFVPDAVRIFAEIGICSQVSFTADTATMRLTSTDDQSEMVFTSPMGSAALKGCHEVQNIGAVETYQRRYLWTTVLEIVEHDALDAQTGNKEPEQEKPIDDAQFAEIATLVEQSGTDLGALCGFYKIEALKFLPASKFNHARAHLANKLAPKERAA